MILIALCYEQTSPLAVSHTASDSVCPFQEIFPIPWDVKKGLKFFESFFNAECRVQNTELRCRKATN